MEFLTSSTHLHIFTWVGGVIFFLISAVMAKGSKGKKITHMIARLFYVLIVISGAALFFKYQASNAALYGVKFLLGLLTIGFMEMVLVRSEKGKSVGIHWVLFFIFFFATIFLGFKLPI